jgi:hypothetical protein
MSDDRPLSFKYNARDDVLTVEGVSFSGELFRAFGLVQPGTWLRVEERCNGVITVYQPAAELAAKFDELCTKTGH